MILVATLIACEGDTVVQYDNKRWGVQSPTANGHEMPTM